MAYKCPLCGEENQCSSLIAHLFGIHTSRAPDIRCFCGAWAIDESGYSYSDHLRDNGGAEQHCIDYLMGIKPT